MLGRTLTFPPFTLDLDAACLRRGRTRLPLTPKDFALLHYLVTHAKQVISHSELLRAVWGDTVVSPEVLKVRVGRLRRLLGDKVAAPRFIANVHGQGYRFLSAVTTQPVLSGQFSVSSSDKARQKSPQLTTDNWQLTTHLVGRETELAQLHSWLDRAINGERQIVFVTGEPGIGKTALLEAFVAEVRDQEKSQIAKVKSY